MIGRVFDDCLHTYVHTYIYTALLLKRNPLCCQITFLRSEFGLNFKSVMVWVVCYLSVIHSYLSTFNFLEIAAPVTMVRCCILMLHTYVYMCWGVCVCVCVCVCVLGCVSVRNTSVLKLKLANMPYLTTATACVCVCACVSLCVALPPHT